MNPRKRQNAACCRIAMTDGREDGKGKTNPYGGYEWIKLCMGHSEGYGEWLQTQTCSMPGCIKERSGTMIDGVMSMVCMQHLRSETTAMDRKEEEKCNKVEERRERKVERDVQKDGDLEALRRVVKL